MSIAPLQLTQEKAPMTSKIFRILPTKVTFHFKIHWLASYFAVQGSPESKQREKIFMWQWKNSKEKERLKENGQRANEERWKLYENLKLIIHIIPQLSTLKVYEFFSLCSGQLWLCETNATNLAQHFTSHFLIQFVCQEIFLWKQFYLMLFIYSAMYHNYPNLVRTEK